MNKIVITSDFHIKEDHLEDISNVMDQIANFAIYNKVKWLWFLGDLYNSRKPTPLCQMVANKWVRKIVENKIKLLIIIGNHDTGLNISAVHYLNTLKVPNVFVRKSPYIFEEKYYLGHCALKESKLGIQNISLKDEISMNDLITRYPNVKAYFLGHIHKMQKLNDNPPIVHVGSPERMDFGERNEGKAFIYLENNKMKVIPLVTRPMIQLDLTPENLVVPKIPEGSIVKIVFTGKKSEIKNINEKEIIKQIPNPKSIKIVYNPIRELSSRSKIINETATPVLCFSEYARLHNLDEETVLLGKKIIEENL